MSYSSLLSWLVEEAGICFEPDGLVVIPYRLPDCRLYAERVIAPNGRRWWRPGDGRQLIPFGLEKLSRERMRPYACLAIAEGESDALALRAAYNGTALEVIGIPGARCWRSEWATLARGYAAVYVFGDGDQAGRALNADVVRDVPGALIVDVPAGGDVRDLLEARGRGAVDELLCRADAIAEFMRMGRAA
jgi:hypothetical protein